MMCCIPGQGLCIPDICHKHHKRCLWRKNLSCGEIFPYDRLSCGEGSPHDKLSVGKCLHIENKEKNQVMWRNVEQNLSCGDISPHDKCGDKSFLSLFMLFCCEICFVAIYAVLPRNLFCRDLRVFVWRKN